MAEDLIHPANPLSGTVPTEPYGKDKKRERRPPAAVRRRKREEEPPPPPADDGMPHIDEYV